MGQETRVCGAPECEEEFTPYRSDHRFCSDACRARAYRGCERERTKRRVMEAVERALEEAL